jgi:hypothetical protein
LPSDGALSSPETRHSAAVGRPLDGELRPVPEKSSLITALILERPMCTDCIGTKSTLIPEAVEAYLSVMSRVLRLHRGGGECSACGAITQVVSCSLL